MIKQTRAMIVLMMSTKKTSDGLSSKIDSRKTTRHNPLNAVNIGLITRAVVVCLLRNSNPIGPPVKKAGTL